jgi:hypothetical protein
LRAKHCGYGLVVGSKLLSTLSSSFKLLKAFKIILALSLVLSLYLEDASRTRW